MSLAQAGFVGLAICLFDLVALMIVLAFICAFSSDFLRRVFLSFLVWCLGDLEGEARLACGVSLGDFD